MFHYTYITYGECGRFYYGVRSCVCAPKDDVYWGSHTDVTYLPKRKRILSLWPSREEAIREEIRIHSAKNVAKNPRYANKANQTSTGFSTSVWSEKWDSDPEWRELQLVRLRAQQLVLSQNKKITMKGENNVAKRPEVRKKISEGQLGEKNHRFGKKMPEEQKKKISNLLSGKPKPDSMKQKLSKISRGRKKITDGNRNTWLHPGETIPEGWRYVNPPRA